MSFLGLKRSDNGYNYIQNKDNKTRRVDPKKIREVYDDLKDDDDNIISVDGIIKMCEQMSIDPFSDKRILYVAWKFEAKTGSQFSEEEFMEGMSKLGCDSIIKLKESLYSIEKELEDTTQFREFFRFVFEISREGTQKTLEKEIVMSLLEMVLLKKYPVIESIIDFLKESNYNRITHDQWNNFLEFSIQIGKDLTKYDPDGAWPLLIDEYMDWVKGKEKKS